MTPELEMGVDVQLKAIGSVVDGVGWRCTYSLHTGPTCVLLGRDMRSITVKTGKQGAASRRTMYTRVRSRTLASGAPSTAVAPATPQATDISVSQ